MMSFRSFIVRRRPRRREIVYFGLGIFLLNFAVSYYYSSKPVLINANLSGSNEDSVYYKQPRSKGSHKLKTPNDNAKSNSIDAMPISVDVKQYKVIKKNVI